MRMWQIITILVSAFVVLVGLRLGTAALLDSLDGSRTQLLHAAD